MNTNPKRDNTGRQPGEVGTAKHTSAFYYPKPATVIGRVLGHMLSEKSINSKQTLDWFGSSRLAALIHAIKRNGWHVSREDFETPTRDGDRRAFVTRYWIDSAIIDEAGDAGRAYVEAAAQAHRAIKGAHNGD